MLLLYVGIVISHLAITVSFSPKNPGLSEPFTDKKEQVNWEKRTTKLKYGELEHTHLDDDYVKGSIWPKPQVENRQMVDFSISPEDFELTTAGAGKNSDILKSAIERYKELVFPKSVTDSADKSPIKSLEITVKTNNENLNFDMDEYCTSVLI